MMRRVFPSFVAGLSLCLVLSACVAPRTREALPVDPVQARANDARRAALAEWNLSGRIAVSNGDRGGTGRIDWRQEAGGYTISLSAPVTRQSWQLSGNDRGARLEGIAGGPREDVDVEQLLLSATGWNIPVRALQDWVRGIPAPAAEFGPEKHVYSGSLPASLEQAGWTIEYQEWHPAGADGSQLPRRIVARSGDASVKLMIDEWIAGSPRGSAD
jgi:outer membrane lipoprotein LolB